MLQKTGSTTDFKIVSFLNSHPGEFFSLDEIKENTGLVYSSMTSRLCFIVRTDVGRHMRKKILAGGKKVSYSIIPGKTTPALLAMLDTEASDENIPQLEMAEETTKKKEMRKTSTDYLILNLLFSNKHTWFTIHDISTEIDKNYYTTRTRLSWLLNQPEMAHVLSSVNDGVFVKYSMNPNGYTFEQVLGFIGSKEKEFPQPKARKTKTVSMPELGKIVSTHKKVSFSGEVDFSNIARGVVKLNGTFSLPE